MLVQVVARCKEDIIKAKGVKPTLSPNLNTLATVEALDVKKLLFIGVGCQVRPCLHLHLLHGMILQFTLSIYFGSHCIVSLLADCQLCSLFHTCEMVISEGTDKSQNVTTTLFSLHHCTHEHAAADSHVMMQVQALRSVEKYLQLEKLYVLGTNCVDNGPPEGLSKFLKAASSSPETVLHYEFMQVGPCTPIACLSEVTSVLCSAYSSILRLYIANSCVCM